MVLVIAVDFTGVTVARYIKGRIKNGTLTATVLFLHNLSFSIFISHTPITTILAPRNSEFHFNDPRTTAVLCVTQLP